ncbi:MAG: EutN/CcmL family microcompartment protein [Pseudomonadota bacterium]
MKLARVIGTVVATVKDPSIKNLKILMIQPLRDDMKPSGEPIAAIDITQAGPGQLVKWVMARESSMALPDPFAPVDAAITGIVDEVNVEDAGIRDKEEIFEK